MERIPNNSEQQPGSQQNSDLNAFAEANTVGGHPPKPENAEFLAEMRAAHGGINYSSETGAYNVQIPSHHTEHSGGEEKFSHWGKRFRGITWLLGSWFIQGIKKSWADKGSGGGGAPKKPSGGHGGGHSGGHH